MRHPFSWEGQDGLTFTSNILCLFISFPWHFSDKNQSNLPIYTHSSCFETLKLLLFLAVNGSTTDIASHWPA
jgi:hypothetical protein